MDEMLAIIGVLVLLFVVSGIWGLGSGTRKAAEEMERIRKILEKKS